MLLLFTALTSIHGELTSAQKQALFLKAKTSGHSSSSKKSHSTHSASVKKKNGSHSSTPHHPASSTHHSASSTHHSASSHQTATSHATVSHLPSNSSHAATASHQLTTSSAATQTTLSPHAHDLVLPVNPALDSHGSANPVITVEKSGLLQEQVPEPIPTPPPAHGWSWLFGGNHHATYHYLPFSVRWAIDRAPVRHGRWKYIVVHNSGTRGGNARIFDIYHRRVRKMVNGLAYHFVIGNGVSSGNGEIEVGHRWTAQLNGGHVASDYLNDISLGICLVGDYNRDQPTKAQLEALRELIAYLRQRLGTTQGHHATVYAHKEINPRPTDCPGTHFPYQWLHQVFRKG